MGNQRFRRYYIWMCLGVLILSFYPLYMGGHVLWDMLTDGTVMKENYPKYIIPYTPISVAILAGVLLMPLWFKLCKRFALLGGSVVSIGTFFALEILLENKVVVTAAETVTKLEDWQMFMCYIPPEGWGTKVTEYKTQTPVDILMGEYSPAFKLHFYLISILLVLSVLGCIYGFARMLLSGDRKRRKALVLQSVATAIFLGLCILACFTAFWRDGNLEVSPLSAGLMTAFFLLMGLVGGIYAGSFLLGKRNSISVGIPALTASALTALMYMGEMILLNGHLYILGSGFLFNGIAGIILSPFDLLVIGAAGGMTALIFRGLNRRSA